MGEQPPQASVSAVFFALSQARHLAVPALLFLQKNSSQHGTFLLHVDLFFPHGTTPQEIKSSSFFALEQGVHLPEPLLQKRSSQQSLDSPQISFFSPHCAATGEVTGEATGEATGALGAWERTVLVNDINKRKIERRLFIILLCSFSFSVWK
jgi:hypothetical protein